jgi:hypothetical protein
MIGNNCTHKLSEDISNYAFFMIHTKKLFFQLTTLLKQRSDIFPFFFK